MKIVGYTVGTSLPRPDFNQTDPKKGDYIKNKPDIDGLQSTIDSVSDLVGNTKVSVQIENAITNKSDVGHAHDDIYYTESEIDSKLNEKADSDHGHDISDVTGLQSALDSKEVNGAASSALASAKSYTDTKISDLINSAPTTLDTLGEIATAMQTNEDVVSALHDAVGTKANASDVTSHTGNKSNPHAVTKAQIGLENVENKSSATIRGELTKDNVTKALGYTPPTQDTTYSAAGSTLGLVKSGGDVTIADGTITVNDDSHNHSSYLPKSGGTMTGAITLPNSFYKEDGSKGAAIIGKNSDIAGLNGIYFEDAADSHTEGIHFYRGEDTWDTLKAQSGELYFVPNRAKGSAGTKHTVYHSGNLSEPTSASVLPNDKGEIKTKFRISTKNYSNSETWYYKICDFPTNNSSNYASAIISGRVGGWSSGTMSFMNALAWNRGTPGIALMDIAGDATSMSSIWNVVDLVLYTNGSSATAANTATLYAKCKGYFTFDLDLELFQSTAKITYDGTYINTTPTGTLAAQASTTSKRVEIVNGKLKVNGNDLALASDISLSTLGITATSAELNYVDGVTSNIQTQLNAKAGTAVATTSANGLMSSTDKTRVDDLYKRVAGYAVTAGTTSAYTATITGVTLTHGTMIALRFNATNAANATLNINSLGAKPIYYKGAAITASRAPANAVMLLVYDTTQVSTGAWHCVYSYDANSTYTNAALGQGYATCDTAAATVAKTASLSSYALTTGGIVAVKFTYDVPANATLNINSKGAKAIYYKGAAITNGVIKAGDIATFIYSSQYHLLSIDGAGVKKSSMQRIAFTAPASGWTQESTGRYVQTVSISGITSDTRCMHMDADMSIVTEDNYEDVTKAWSLIDNAETVDGGIKLTAFKEAPSINLNIIADSETFSTELPNASGVNF